MNIIKNDIINELYENKFANQRKLAETIGCSLGSVNKALSQLLADGFVDTEYRLTPKAEEFVREGETKRAIILAAGYGMRMVPINMETPKGLLEINSEPLIERVIIQLKEVGITEIYVVVGFMKERYEYLIDEFGVELIVNEAYFEKNNLHSVALVADKLENSYIIPCDLWCAQNEFHRHELYSWYMVSDGTFRGSHARVNRKNELIFDINVTDGNRMIGISFVHKKDAAALAKRILEMDAEPLHANSFWEEALVTKNKMTCAVRLVPENRVVEINTYEQLRELDSESNHLKSDAIKIITDTFQIDKSEITNITVLKKGMTNRSFLFECKNKKYIMRIPGEGTDSLINRKEEADVYGKIADKKICDDLVYINPENGYKITEFLNGVRNCDPSNLQEVKQCMDFLKKIHDLELQVDHEFDIFGKIEYYESLWDGKKSVYRDYEKTKKHILSLKPFIESHIDRKVLTHIDAVPDNFLFVTDENGEEQIRLIDWEYAGMQDPHVDLAMFSVYAFYNKEQVDQLIDLYFDGDCKQETRIKIYCYVACCGLLWSNWCEYKRIQGVEFGEYSIKQYRYAKDFYLIAEKAMEQLHQ